MKEAVVMAVGKGMSYRSVADSFSIGIDTVTRWMREYKKNGFCKGGYTVNRTFKKIDPEKLIQRLTEKPDCTMVELANEFNCSPVSLRTMAKNLAMSLKKLKRYCEANEEQRRLYMDEIESIPQDKIVYIDETGCEQHYYRDFAWTKRGDTIFQGVYGRHFARTNIIGAKRGREVLAIKQYNEPTKAKLFETWFEQDLSLT